MSAKRLALAAILLVGLGYATMLQNWSDNQSSHYDLIRALDAGRTTIDYGPYPTKDKAEYHGHYFSARAPGLALYSLPFYELLKGAGAPAIARESKALRGEDEMIDFVGLWGNVLPGLILLLLVWRVAERFEPGYGVAAAVIVGLGTMVLPFSTLLFSHVFSAMLGFAAFAVMLRERAGPPRPLLLAAAGLLVGYAITSEYPLAFVAVVLAGYLLSREDAWTPRLLALRAGAYVAGGVVGIVPLLLYNHAAFGSWTHLAYSNIPQQQKGFFGISAPSLPVLATLLFDSRGLLTLSPVLIMGAIGTVLLYRRGNRAEALTSAAVCVCYLGYNSGYYLPFGGGSMGPRFLITLLPFLGFPIALALRRFPGPTLALAGASIAVAIVATITHPLVGYETETIVWGRLLEGGEFQPTIASAFGAGRGWGAIWPFLLAAGAGIALSAVALPRLRLRFATLGWGALALLAWALFAALAPTALGIDHRGLLSIRGAGDPTALDLALHNGSRYPLSTLVEIAAVAGLLALAGAWLFRRAPRRAALSAYSS
ncbi:MAG TPA: hypothetical protein VGX69_10555 [Solirubrobacteraceae bacterium]|jgi:hypothetical protein|nr:hypothetical protein [Solirubrobacteraceae bacterium]